MVIFQILNEQLHKLVKELSYKLLTRACSRILEWSRQRPNLDLVSESRKLDQINQILVHAWLVIWRTIYGQTFIESCLMAGLIRVPCSMHTMLKKNWKKKTWNNFLALVEVMQWMHIMKMMWWKKKNWCSDERIYIKSQEKKQIENLTKE